MFELLSAQRELDEARDLWQTVRVPANRLRFDRAVRAYMIAEQRLNVSIRTTHVQAA